MTSATQISVGLHNSTRWHFLHWVQPVRAALDAGKDIPWILNVGTIHGPRGLAEATTGPRVVPV